MSTISATNARQNLFRLIDQVNDSHEPVLITGKKGSAVLISESDWKAIEETLSIFFCIPGRPRRMRGSSLLPDCARRRRISCAYWNGSHSGTHRHSKSPLAISPEPIPDESTSSIVLCIRSLKTSASSKCFACGPTTTRGRSFEVCSSR